MTSSKQILDITQEGGKSKLQSANFTETYEVSYERTK